MPPHFFLLPVYYFVIADIDRLSVHAEPAVATIARQAVGRRLIQLPELRFDLLIRTRCARGGLPESVSISVADTKKTISGEELLSAPSLETSVLVSSRQLAPIALQEFCVADDSAQQSLVVPTALTAHASLRCARGEERTIVYDAKALDVLINCEIETQSRSD
jgi:hypothetical protein